MHAVAINSGIISTRGCRDLHCNSSNTSRAPLPAMKVSIAEQDLPYMVRPLLITYCPTSAMGKSRSATVVIAYLMHKLRLNPKEALEKLRESRGVCEPNPGFMKQLELYHDMGTPEYVDTDPKYQRWLYERELESSRATMQAPDAEKIRFEDEHAATKEASDVDLRCRKCRWVMTIMVLN